MRARKWLRRIIVLWIVTGLFAVISMFRPPVLCIGTRAIALMDGRIVMVFADRPIFRIPAAAGAAESIGIPSMRMTLVPGPLWWPRWTNMSSFTINAGVRSGLNTYWVWLPILPLLILLSVVAAVLFFVSRRLPAGHCRRCGYDLTGNTSGTCPECGSVVMRSEPEATQGGSLT